MVGKQRFCHTDHPTPAFWENPEYEHGGAFFSLEYSNKGDLFKNLAIWKEEKYRKLQGTYPVVSFPFANVKEV